MRFMVMHKVTDAMEQGLMPEQSVIDGVGKLVGEAIEKKIFLDGDGLKPTSQRVHVKYENGKRTVTEGPFKDAKELVGSYASFTVQSRDEALACCDRLAQAAGGDVELFLGPLVEEWDLTGAPAPADAPKRFLALVRDTRRVSASELKKTGARVSGTLKSTKDGARLHFSSTGKRTTIIDGPFAESKELVAGYSILELPSKDAAIDWATRFGAVVQVNEIDIRMLDD